MSHTEDLAAQVRAAAAGDGGAVRAVIEAVQDPVYRLALRMLGHPADAEDAAQEILVIVVTHLGSFRGERAFMTWVWRIAANHLARVRRGPRPRGLMARQRLPRSTAGATRCTRSIRRNC